MIAPDGTYPKDALVVDGYAADGALLAHPLGGGFQLKLGSQQAAGLREVQAQERGSPLFRRARFMLKGCDTSFEGWTDVSG